MLGSPPTPTPVFSLLLRPHSALAAKADVALARVAKEASSLNAHYRFYAHTDSSISNDPVWVTPAAGSAAWASLPAGAAWAAGTVPAQCSSFVWAAVQRANQGQPALVPPIQLEDRFDPENAKIGLEYGAHDGTYRYTEKERQDAAKDLASKLISKIQKVIDDRVNMFGLGLVSSETVNRLLFVPRLIADQICNSFATDKSEELFEPLWQHPGTGDAVSPDNGSVIFGA